MLRDFRFDAGHSEGARLLSIVDDSLERAAIVVAKSAVAWKGSGDDSATLRLEPRQITTALFFICLMTWRISSASRSR